MEFIELNIEVKAPLNLCTSWRGENFQSELNQLVLITQKLFYCSLPLSELPVRLNPIITFLTLIKLSCDYKIFTNVGFHRGLREEI